MFQVWKEFLTLPIIVVMGRCDSVSYNSRKLTLQRYENTPAPCFVPECNVNSLSNWNSILSTSVRKSNNVHVYDGLTILYPSRRVQGDHESDPDSRLL